MNIINTKYFALVETLIERNWNPTTAPIKLIPHKIYAQNKSHHIVFVTEEENAVLQSLLIPTLTEKLS